MAREGTRSQTRKTDPMPTVAVDQPTGSKLSTLLIQ